MMSTTEIRHLSNKAAKRAAAENRVPYVPFDREEVEQYSPFPFPNIGSYEPPKWKEVDYEANGLDGALFCDKTGWGSPNEPALTVAQLKYKLLELYDQNSDWGYAIIEEGPFQLCIGIFEETHGKKRKARKGRRTGRSSRAN